MQQLGAEFRIALRAMGRDRAFALPVLLILTLCIAANAATFSVLYSVVLRPLPLRDPSRLVWISNSFPQAGAVEADNSVPDYFDRRQGVPASAEVAGLCRAGR